MPPKQTPKKNPKGQPRARAKPGPVQPHEEDPLPVSLTPIPLPLQQLLLDTFKAALLRTTTNDDNENDENKGYLDLKPLIQSIKTHLYNRDFDSAFTDADEDVLRAYALRWSAGRALGYAGLLRGVLELGQEDMRGRGRGRVICIGGGGGAEIVALGAVWRDILDERRRTSTNRSPGTTTNTGLFAGVSVTAVDIADWSGVIRRLDSGLRSPALHPESAPLLPGEEGGEGGFEIEFRRADVLDLSDEALGALFNGDDATSESASAGPSILVTLMFTLNELFSTSMAKATSFLLRMTDSLQPGTILLVVDSPGSYSTLKLGTGGSGSGQKERRYPMKFLLDHTLLSVAAGKWERVFSQDSRWWRRDAARLRYDVGEGGGLEDMRYQVHIYRRVGGL